MKKSKLTAFLLCGLGVIGIAGIHRFYLGKIGTGFLWLFSLGFLGLGTIIDLFTLDSQIDLYNVEIELNQIKNCNMIPNKTNKQIQRTKVEKMSLK